MIGAALAGGSQQRPLQNARVDVWSEFADQLSEQPDEHIVDERADPHLGVAR